MDVKYDPAAIKQLKAIPKADVKRLRDAVQQVANLHPQRQSFATEMQGEPGYWRIRKGDWRVVYHMDDDVLTVLSIGNRREIYR